MKLEAYRSNHQPQEPEIITNNCLHTDVLSDGVHPLVGQPHSTQVTAPALLVVGIRFHHALSEGKPGFTAWIRAEASTCHMSSSLCVAHNSRVTVCLIVLRYEPRVGAQNAMFDIAISSSSLHS